VFGREDVLINNIAWLLRHVPVFGIAGRGDYELRPVAVDDVARLCVELGARSDDAVVDAVGPETFSFRDMVRMIRDAIGAHTALVRAPRPAVMVASRILSAALRDVVLTRDELDGMMHGLVTTNGPATGSVVLSEWVMQHAETLGTRYASELGRHYVGAQNDQVNV
jgi:NADH dehydrogenase